jgi:sensor histidine kinase YesM
MRYLLMDYGTQSTVADEINHAADFIKLQQIRYPGNIELNVCIQPESGAVQMPRLVVQTFAENVFKHAFQYGKPLKVSISSAISSDYVCIFVDDNGGGFGNRLENGNPAQGTGIANIRRTLELLYGKPDLLKLISLENGGARVQILIPVTNANGGAKN